MQAEGYFIIDNKKHIEWYKFIPLFNQLPVLLRDKIDAILPKN
jgi:hypothetical protein